MSTFLIFSEYGELLDLALALKREGHEVEMVIDKEYSKIGDGLVTKCKTWWRHIGQNNIWVFDGCERGDLQDWLREKGEAVFGGSKEADRLENDRQLGQKLFRAAGFYQPESKNFKSIDEALKFVTENNDKKWILKQNGNAPKSINYKGEFSNNADMIFHLQELKNKWNEAQYGQVDFDLMEVVEGLEVAASAFFNGHDFLKNKDGKVVGFLNFEEKKEADNGLGETTGEMGTTFIGTTEDNKLFSDILLRPKIKEALITAKFRGVFDINCIKTDKGLVALEPTCRFGIPATSYEFIEGLENAAEVIDGVARGTDVEAKVKPGVGMVMCVVAKPYPVESDVDDESSSIDERIWPLNGGKPAKNFTPEQLKHIHLQNVYYDNGYFVATKNGYILTVTGTGRTIQQSRDKLIEYIKDNIFISSMKYRTDIGLRVEKSLGLEDTSKKTKEELQKSFEEQVAKIKEDMDAKVSKIEENRKENLSKIKQKLREQIYG